MIEKRVTEALLTDGRIRLSTNEVRQIGLPEHSGTVDIEFEGDALVAQWTGGSAALHGEAFAERLQDHCQIGGLVRLTRVGGVIRVESVSKASSAISVPPTHADAMRVTSPPTKPTTRVRRRSTERVFRADGDFEWSSDQRVGILTAARGALESAIKAGGFDSRQLVDLRMEGERLATMDGFDELIAVDVANVDRMPHQEAVARQVLTKMRGRAVLADEVGLGKTIEAGLVAKELALRGLARSMLVICPATLREQWRSELEEKFELPFDIAYSSNEIGQQERLVVSLHLAARNGETLSARSWDVVIIDEAHRTTGKGAAKTRAMVESLSKKARFVLFLTATPVQNELLELYRLVDMLRPGTLGSSREFTARFVDGADPRRPRNPSDLRRLASSAMIRTTRAQAGVDRVKRRTTDVPVTLGKPEQELYVLATDLLRSVMTDKADSMRRRHLAFRLAGSPYSMGTTALRMAASHSSPQARRLLEEIGHRAMDLRTSAREDKALNLTKTWLSEHGRVLVFTQHTDTVQALLRRYDQEGIAAVPFHGGMARGERAKAVQAFKSGTAQVLVSTDAGAEGQNLQFCNCVLNYDLPWNPMRIEQRIGRVDRLTQPRDEVFVANMFARDTIDEHVYRLLHDKLRMFELLFGQVTTILGELDSQKESTFEGRVMEALFSDSDSQMRSILDELGADLERARSKGEAMVSADQGLSSWLATAKDHRREISGTATELLPERRADEERKRQVQVQKWVRKVIRETGGQIVHDTKADENSFITATFPDDFADDLGGRAQLHLAFSRRGLDEHPLAELCAVGSPSFGELLGLLRERGDVHIAVPTWSSDAPPPAARHDTKAIERTAWTMVHSDAWSGRAVFRLEVGATELAESIIEVKLPSEAAPRSMPVTSLAADAPVPAPLRKPRSLIHRIEREADLKARGVRAKAEKELQKAITEERERILQRYDQQLTEVGRGTEWSALKKARDQEEARLNRAPDVRARLEMLALDLTEHDMRVEETWTHRRSGVTIVTQRFVGEPLSVPSAVTGEHVHTLSLCASGHSIDERERITCPSCDTDVCDACGPAGRLVPCLLCGLSACGSCRSANFGLCRGCGGAQRVPERDRPGSIAWLGREGVAIHVAARSAWVERPGGAGVLLIARGVEITEHRRMVAAYARSRGLPACAGLSSTVRDIPPIGSLDEVVLATDTSFDAVLELGAGGSSDMDEVALPFVPLVDAEPLLTESDVGLAGFMAHLRQLCPPDPAPTIHATLTPALREKGLDGAGVFVREVTVDENGQRLETSSHRAPWVVETAENALRTGIVASAQLDGDVVGTLHRVNGAVIAEVSDGAVTWERFIVPEDSTIEAEITFHRHLQDAGQPGGRVGVLDFEQPTDECMLRSSRSTLIEREVTSAWVFGGEPESARLASAADLELVETASAEVPDTWEQLPSALGNRLLDLTLLRPTHVLHVESTVTDSWRDRGTRTLTYPIRVHSSPFVRLDDTDHAATDFGVCENGHLFTPDTDRRCDSCSHWYCRACDATGPLHLCQCGRSACRTCLGVQHHLLEQRCASCGTASCNSCGADPGFTACQVCARTMCRSCVDDNRRCTACRSFAPAELDERLGLPGELACAGAEVSIGRDGTSAVVLIQTISRREIAVLESGQLVTWTTCAAAAPDAYMRLALGMAVRLAADVTVTVESHRAPEPPERMITLDEHHTWRPAMRVGDQLLQTFDRDLTSPTTDPVDYIVDALGMSGLRLPETRSQPLWISWPQPPDSLPIPVVCSTVAVKERVGVTDRGVAKWSASGPDQELQVVEWTEDDGPDNDEAWFPCLRRRAQASAFGIEACVLQHGTTTVLRVRHNARSQTFAVHDDLWSGDGLILQELLGLRSPVSAVAQYTVPADIATSTVRKAAKVSRLVEPLPLVSAMIGASRVSDARRDWAPQSAPRRPPLDTLEPDLLGELRLRFPKREGTAVSIGARVTEVWLNAVGRSAELRYALAPGVQMVLAADVSTGQSAPIVSLDREGHLVADPVVCPYCAADTCSVCAVRVSECHACGQAICGECATASPPGFCPACASLKRPGRLGLVKLGHWSKLTELYVGSDAAHEVVLERVEPGWTIRVGAEARPVEPSIVAQLLQRADP